MADRGEYRAALANLPRRRDGLLPALHAAHAVEGWLPEAAIEAVGEHVFVPLSELYGIISSYSELRLRPPHEPHIELCVGLACRMDGADALLAAAAADGIQVETVACRFLCGVAPVAEVGGVYRGRVTALTPGPSPVATGEGGAAMMGAPLSPTHDRDGQHPQDPRRDRLPSPVATGEGPGVRAIRVATSLCARSVGAEDVLAALRRAAPEIEITPVGCDGVCSAQPVVTVVDGAGATRRYERVVPSDAAAILGGAVAPVDGDPLAGQVRRVLARCGAIDPESLDAARAHGAYEAFDRARAMAAEELVALVKEAGLRGRGGAYFPLALKWESVRQHPAPRYLVVNAEEGEPGAFKDRHLMEGDPHLLVEGVAIAAHAAGAERVFFYINGQARLSAERVARAIEDAAAAGLLAGLRLEIYRGAGGYVCGEESVILNSIEGERAVPRPRPPLPVDAGLWGRPTVISNVETLCNLPLIVREGAGGFRGAGTVAYPGTKLVSVSGAVRRPGLYEAPLGVTTRELLALAGGLPEGRTLQAVVMGGPSGGFLPPDMLDVPLEGGLIHPSGPVLGSGGVVALDERTPLPVALRELTAYNAAESCGKCTPCREGASRALAVLERAGDGALSGTDRAELLELCDLMQFASLCGLGQMAPGPIRSALTLFP